MGRPVPTGGPVRSRAAEGGRELVGAQRTSVNRVLRTLEERGLVRVAYRQVEILDEEGLLLLGGGDVPVPARPAVS